MNNIKEKENKHNKKHLVYSDGVTIMYDYNCKACRDIYTLPEPIDEKKWREELWYEVMEDYVVTAELGHLARDQKKHKDEMRGHLEKLESFISTLLSIARKEERDLFNKKLESIYKNLCLYHCAEHKLLKKEIKELLLLTN